MAPDMLMGLDKARKEELHNDMVDAIRGRLFDTPSPPVYIGADFGKGKSLSSLMLTDRVTGKVVCITNNVAISINEKMNMSVHENDFPSIPPVTWSVKVETAKQIRNFRKFRRELGLRKPRIPRKLKKKLKTDIKLMRYEETE